MPSEFEAEIRNSMRQLQSVIEGVGKAQGKTTAEVAKFAAAAKAAFGGSAKPLADAEKAARAHARAIHEIGAAAARVGGPLGDMISRFASTTSSSTGLTRLALAATGVGVALAVVNGVVKRSEEAARAAAESWKQMTQAVIGAHTAANAVGTAGLSQAGVRRPLIAAGPEAVAMAGVLTTSQKYGGLDPDDAAAGTAAIYNKYGPGERAAATAFHARYLAKTGAFSFAEAAQGLIGRGGDASAPGLGLAMASRLYAEKTGRRGNPEAAYLAAVGNVDADASGYLQGVEGTNRVHGLTQEVQRTAVANGRAKTAALGELASAKDPLSAAVLQVANSNAIIGQSLQKVADAQNGLVAWLEHYPGQVLGGSGSEQDAANRFNAAQAGGAAAYAP